jgi:hypothetical protein
MAEVGEVGLSMAEVGEPSLSAETFNALAEFYREQEEREQRQAGGAEVGDVELPEDWQFSQFWYSPATAAALAGAVAAAVGDGEASVACVSAPTLYRALKKLDKPNLKVKVFEYDNRFASFGPDFQFYDYKSPLDIDRGLREQFDLVFADPPFLSEECLTKTAVTMKFLAKEPHRLVLCSGEVMAGLAARLLDLRICSFLPEHENNLANQFRCFANFDLDGLLAS